MYMCVYIYICIHISIYIPWATPSTMHPNASSWQSLYCLASQFCLARSGLVNAASQLPRGVVQLHQLFALQVDTTPAGDAAELGAIHRKWDAAGYRPKVSFFFVY